MDNSNSRESLILIRDSRILEKYAQNTVKFSCLFVPSASVNYFDLEDPFRLVRLDQPMDTLRELNGLVAIDAVQHRPDIFPI